MDVGRNERGKGLSDPRPWHVASQTPHNATFGVQVGIGMGLGLGLGLGRLFVYFHFFPFVLIDLFLIYFVSLVCVPRVCNGSRCIDDLHLNVLQRGLASPPRPVRRCALVGVAWPRARLAWRLTLVLASRLARVLRSRLGR